MGVCVRARGRVRKFKQREKERKEEGEKERRKREREIEWGRRERRCKRRLMGDKEHRDVTRKNKNKQNVDVRDT